MSEPDGPRRIGALWSPEAREELPAVDRETAMQILRCPDRYLTAGAGDVKKLKSPLIGLRLRCGDYRIFFDSKENDKIQITIRRTPLHESPDGLCPPGRLTSAL